MARQQTQKPEASEESLAERGLRIERKPYPESAQEGGENLDPPLDGNVEEQTVGGSANRDLSDLGKRAGS